MFVDFDEIFCPAPVQQKKQKKMSEMIKKSILEYTKEKRCCVCANSEEVHGFLSDLVHTVCKITEKEVEGKCVDCCKNWVVLYPEYESEE